MMCASLKTTKVAPEGNAMQLTPGTREDIFFMGIMQTWCQMKRYRKRVVQASEKLINIIQTSFASDFDTL